MGYFFFKLLPNKHILKCINFTLLRSVITEYNTITELNQIFNPFVPNL